MHAVIALLLYIATVGTAIAETAGQVGPDPRYRIRLTVHGVAVKGSQELEANLAGKTSFADRDAVFAANPIPELTRDQTSQLIVTITEPDGVTKSYTRGPRISYDSLGCLTVSPDSVLTARPSGSSCRFPEEPTLLVFFNDTAGKPIAYSAFAFKYR